jgi:hypothetical protein
MDVPPEKSIFLAKPFLYNLTASFTLFILLPPKTKMRSAFLILSPFAK